MPDLSIDLDLLATHLQNKMSSEDLSVRAAAGQIGFGAATLSRLLQGTKSENVPDLKNVIKAAAWVGMTVGDVSSETRRRPSTIADVEVHLRALPGLAAQDVEALVAMVKAGYRHAKELRTKKGS
jgi:DNA-binding MurR/RpiR family transcriptional regulator